MYTTRTTMQKINGSFVEGEIFLRLKKAAREAGVVFARSIDFAKRDLWVKAVDVDHIFQPLASATDDLGIYADNYNANSQCRLLDVKSGYPKGRWVDHDDKVNLFLVSLFHDLDTIYVIPSNRIRILETRIGADETYDFESPNFLPLLLPYKWTTNRLGILLQQIASGKTLQNPDTLIEVDWRAQEYAFRDEVHAFIKPKHQDSATALLEFEWMTRPTRRLLNYRIRIDFCDLQPYFGDLKVVDTVTRSERVIQHKTTLGKKIIYSRAEWADVSDKWDFLIWDDRSREEISIYTRNQFFSSDDEPTDTANCLNIAAATFSTRTPEEAVTSGRNILEFLAGKWDHARDGWLQAAKLFRLQDVVVGGPGDAERNEEDENSNEDTEEVDPGEAQILQADDQEFEADVANENLQLRTKAICAEYNIQARQQKNPTRMVPIYLADHHQHYHPYGDAIIALLDQGNTGWNDKQVSAWFWRSDHSAFATPCVTVRFVHQSFRYRRLDSVSFLLDMRAFRLPPTNQPVFYLGVPYFQQESPEKLLFYPGEHVQFPSEFLHHQRDASSKKQWVSFSVDMLRDTSEKQGAIYPTVPEAPFWNSVSDIADSAFRLLKSVAAYELLFTGTKPIEVARYRMDIRAIVQAMVTHGLGTRMSKNTEASEEVGSAKMPRTSFERSRLAISYLNFAAMKEVCEIHDVRSLGRDRWGMVDELVQIPGMGEIAKSKRTDDLSRLTTEDARKIFSKEALNDMAASLCIDE